MQYATLGKTSVRVSRVVFGAMARGSESNDAYTRALHAALEAGVTSIDTAPLYGFGQSERLVGQAIRGRRENVQILTKVGLRWDAEHGEILFSGFRDGKPICVRKDSRPESIVWEIERSLERLGVDAVDALQVHHPDVHTPIADTVHALGKLVTQGKVKALGVSNFLPSQVREVQCALGATPLACLQDEYNLVRRGAERALLPLARELELGFLCYSPLEQGLLAGKLLSGPLRKGDGRENHASFHARNADPVHCVLQEVVQPIADQHQATLAQIGLAWLLAQPGVTSVIAAASTEAQARQNAAAAEIVLREDELWRLRSAFEALSYDDSAGRGFGASAQRLARRALRVLRRSVRVWS